MWGVGKRRKRKQIIISRRQIKNYQSPKVFNQGYKKSVVDKAKLPKFNRRALGNIFILLLVIVGAYWLFYSSYFTISDVMVDGNKTISSDSLKSLIPIGENIFLFSTAGARDKAVLIYPQIKEIAFFKGIPNAVKIQVVERESKLIWQTNGLRYLIDPDGIVSRQLDATETSDLPVVADNKNQPVTNGQQILTYDFISFVTEINNNFNQFSNFKATGFSIDETTYDLTINSDSGIKVFFDTTRPAAGQLINLQKILVNYRDAIHEYIDLRVDGWGYYK